MIAVDNNTKQAYHGGGVVTVYSSTIAANARGSLSPESILIEENVVAGDRIYYKRPCVRDGGGSGTVQLTYDGVPTISGTYGTYVTDFKINAGALTTGIAVHYEVDATEALFTLPAQDAEGWSIIPEPESTARLIYCDPTGGNNATAGPAGTGTDAYTTATIPGTHWRTDPGAVNAYEDWDAAWSLFRDGEGDYILLKRGETFTVTAAMGGKTIGAGKSHTFPHVFCDYGSGAKPIVRAHPDLPENTDMWTAVNEDSFNHIYNIHFWQQYRDPTHPDFVGYGLTRYGAKPIRFYPGFSSAVDLDGIHIEGCVFDYCSGTSTFGEGPFAICRFVWRRNISRHSYNETGNALGMGGIGVAALIEESLFYHNGWTQERDIGTYPAGNGTGTHSGGIGDTTFSGTITGYEANMVGAPVRNNAGSDVYGRIDTITPTSLTATTQLEYGGGPMTFDDGDSILIFGERMAGQAHGESHNIYLNKHKGSIIRNNISIASASSGFKNTAWPTVNEYDSGTATPGGSSTTLFATATFLSDVQVGQLARNRTDLSTALITNVVSNTELTTEVLTGGTTNTWTSGDEYQIVPPPPYEEFQYDTCIYNNYFADNGVDYSCDLNFENRDWQLRLFRQRYMNNVMTKTAEADTRTGVFFGGVALWLKWWDAGCVGKNIITMLPANAPVGMNWNDQSRDVIISRNKLVNLGIASGTQTTVNRGHIAFSPNEYDMTGMQILYNDFQNKTTDGRLISSLNSAEGFTWEGNRYFSIAASSGWGELDNVAKSITEVVADTGETGYSETEITYQSVMTHEDYMTSIGEVTTTIDQMAASVAAMMVPGSWDVNYTGEYIVVAFQQEYTE